MKTHMGPLHLAVLYVCVRIRVPLPMSASAIVFDPTAYVAAQLRTLLMYVLVLFVNA